MNSFLVPFSVIISLMIIVAMARTTESYRLALNADSDERIPSSQIDRLCSSMATMKVKRFAVPFPDMNRFLSTSHKLHHHHAHATATKHDFHAYLCSLSKDSEEMNNFISIFIDEHGQPPAFDLFESCEQVAKRDIEETTPIIRWDDLPDICSNRATSRAVR